MMTVSSEEDSPSISFCFVYRDVKRSFISR